MSAPSKACDFLSVKVRWIRPNQSFITDNRICRGNKSDMSGSAAFRNSDDFSGSGYRNEADCFSPFLRRMIPHQKKYGGTGLGLVISRKFCQMMAATS